MSILFLYLLLFLAISVIYILIRKIAIVHISDDESILDQSKKTMNNAIYLPRIKKLLVLISLAGIILGVCLSLMLIFGYSIVFLPAVALAILSIIIGFSKHKKLKQLIDTDK